MKNMSPEDMMKASQKAQEQVRICEQRALRLRTYQLHRLIQSFSFVLLLLLSQMANMSDAERRQAMENIEKMNEQNK